jgi:hypothetical protein
MTDWLHPNRRDGVTVPTIWIAVALSVLLHVAIMWKWLPKLHFPSPEDSKIGESRGALVVQLAPPFRAPTPIPESESRPVPPPRPRSPPPPPPPPPRPAAPVIALKTPGPNAAPSTAPAPPPAPAVTPPAQPRPPASSGDFAADLEARRRARGEAPAAAQFSIASAPAAEDDKARANRVAAANLATQRRQTFGYDPSQGGGLFQIMRVGYVDGEFLFFGWNKDVRRNTKQLIEVQKGNNPDTRIAIVRKMIAIIREYEQEDFLWESQRLGRSVTLSARARDTAGLEEFMMHEFFPEDPRVPR